MIRKIKTASDLLNWYNEQYSAIQKQFPKMLAKYESMDRSLLVAECCRLFLTARDAVKDNWLICRCLKDEEIETIQKEVTRIERPREFNQNN